jgi:ribosomal protein L18E
LTNPENTDAQDLIMTLEQVSSEDSKNVWTKYSFL